MTQRYVVGLGLFVFGLLSPLAASSASAQVRPRIVIGFDTSGSMALDFGGLPSFGDGVTTGCALGGGHYCGANCTAGIDTNCDGLLNDSRIYNAKRAVYDVVSAFGDVDWALARFGMTTAANTACRAAQDFECNPAGPYVTSLGDPFCNTGGGCFWNWSPLYPAACQPTIRNRVAGNPLVCTNYAGGCGLGGNILVGFSDLGPWAGRDNTYGILRWVDGVETSFNAGTTPSNFCNHTGAGDCELRADGPTPIGELLTAIQGYVAPIEAADPLSGTCRPYSVLLITDGAETCGGNPSATAGVLRAAGIQTYVVGVAIDAGSRPGLNAIATAGGTDAGAPGGDSAFFADNAVALSAGVGDIVQRSLRFETCNGADDDCDTRIDEGVLNACGTCGAVPVEVCNGADDDCDGTIDDGVRNACGTCGAVPAETCNRVDDNCNGAIDEGGVCGSCVFSPEICDNVDNDCDTRVDEALSRSCGAAIGRCTVGSQTCAAGVWGMCSGITPIAEACNGIDDDCNGIVDGLTRSCGVATGECNPGVETCTGGAFGTCTGAIGPSTELCDTRDNDCDGRVDEMATGTGGACGTSTGECNPGTLACVAGAIVCTGGVSASPETCDNRDNDCDARTDESVPTMGACGPTLGECRAGVNTCVAGAFVCTGARGAVAELCNALDDDCDGRTDELNPGGGAACGTATGECALGTSLCMGGALTCSGDVRPRTETCNALDDDCDGLVDEMNPGGGASCGVTDVGECELGAQRCMAGVLVCVGERGSRAELCDTVDNDCDGTVDEGNPEAGMACGSDAGECAPGLTACVSGMLECTGAVGPMAESCNALDDDCDTVVDEDLGIGEACGTDTGECAPGVQRCVGGAVICDGALEGSEETCNGLDDDCDASTDEGLGLGAACGVDEGLCMAGRQMCSDGRIICIGGVDPTPEACDCEDDDCDGTVDEEAGGALCPAGSACVDCGCALPCAEGEFGPECPTGRTPTDSGGTCYCTAERCNGRACAMQTIEEGGEVRCAPDATDVSNCVCRSNECTFPCFGVVCSEGTICDPSDPAGTCVEDNCRGLGCPGTEVCNLATGECEVDRCSAITCDTGEACRDGVCEGSCAEVTCDTGERCAAGTCVTDLCAESSCVGGTVCDEATGDCVADMCTAITCSGDTVCDPVTGDCVEDPCARLRCPGGEVCREGECGPRDLPDAGFDAGFDAGVEDLDPYRRGLATGGACFCAAAGVGTRGDSGAPLGLSILGLLGLVLFARKVGRRQVATFPFAKRSLLIRRAAVTAVGLSLGITGCNVEPFCFDCVDETLDAGARDVGADTDVGERPDVGRDASDAPSDARPDGCLASEACNAIDDDCDGNTDEGIDTLTDEENCGGCGIVCAPAGAFGECVAGACTIRSCDVGRFDRDGVVDNGCEERCLPTGTDDTLCDLRDNDCDFMVDEDVLLDTDPANCGRCGRTCRFVHAAASCAAGACELGACEAGFYDLDGLPGNGCEYTCTPADPLVESCNGSDDDCDGSIDEGDPGGGGSCGSDVGACSFGVEHCVMGVITCMGGVSPQAELCNGGDDDCDTRTDEENPEGGRLCGSSTGTCSSGREECRAGALACIGAVTPVAELCDGLDNNCDTSIDEGNPGGGGTCGSNTGACMFGALACRGGVVTCEGGRGPGTESCNGIDDDCDTRVDEGNPGGGGSCGSDVGVCRPGTLTCGSGTLSCVGATGPTGAETCNGLDDNCNGSIDEGNPGGGGACGTDTGECTAGSLLCASGTLVCTGAVGPGVEACNTRDDDCDTRTDEAFSLMTDVTNCGTCGNVCNLANAFESCVAGGCRIAACEPGFVNADGNQLNGCEYGCTPAGAEACNGRDDDCDTRTDETLTTPMNFCNPNGVCGGTSPTCSGMSGWACNYPAATFQSTETRCDGRDNDCDGQIDEPFAGINPATGAGLSCAVGLGECRRTGTFMCALDQLSAVCSVTTPGPATAELCDNRDNNCDGITDNGILPSDIPTVSIPRSGGGTVRVMAYEASRPDATAVSSGTVGTLACSRPNVMPWTTVTWADANNACCALNPGGTCTGTTGWRLCDAPDWQNACDGPAAAPCAWSYGTAATCSVSAPTTCNGEEFDSGAAAGDQDALFTTGSPTFPMCFANWGSSGNIFDMSGNVKEWTYTPTVGDPSIHYIRGGSYTNVEPGRSCAFNFTVGSSTFAFPNTGFRCCMY